MSPVRSLTTNVPRGSKPCATPRVLLKAVQLGGAKLGATPPTARPGERLYKLFILSPRRVLVRRWIQTPSAAAVLSTVQTEGCVPRSFPSGPPSHAAQCTRFPANGAPLESLVGSEREAHGYRVGINGFGRIGRNFTARTSERGGEFEVVAINDPGDARTMAHLLANDSNYGRLEGGARRPTERSLVAGKHELQVLSERDPADLPWRRPRRRPGDRVDGVLHEGGRRAPIWTRARGKS